MTVIPGPWPEARNRYLFDLFKEALPRLPPAEVIQIMTSVGIDQPALLALSKVFERERDRRRRIAGC